MLSDEEILKLWHTPGFEGSYRGLRTLQVVLKLNLNENVSLKRLHDILSKDSLYLIHQKTVKHFPRRNYFVHSYGELCQMDIAVMHPIEEYHYFLLLVDVFSTKVFTEPLKSRKDTEVISALAKIISRFSSEIHVIQADREGAFLSAEFKRFINKQHIVFRDNAINPSLHYTSRFLRIKLDHRSIPEYGAQLLTY